MLKTQILTILVLCFIIEGCSVKRNQFDINLPSNRKVVHNPSTKKLLSYHISYPPVREQHAIDESFNKAMEYTFSGQSVEWRNGVNDNHGHITPIKTYKNAEGYYCRDFILTSYINDSHLTHKDTACRNQDGAWLVSDK